MMKKALSFVFFLILLLVFCTYAVIAIRPSEGGGIQLLDTETPEYLKPADSQDLSTLSRLYENPFPTLVQRTADGHIRTRQTDGQAARELTLQYPELTISCIWPATAAPLLLVPDLTVMNLRTEDGYRFSVLSMPAIYAENDEQRCLYFSDETAA